MGPEARGFETSCCTRTKDPEAIAGTLETRGGPISSLERRKKEYEADGRSLRLGPPKAGDSTPSVKFEGVGAAKGLIARFSAPADPERTPASGADKTTRVPPRFMMRGFATTATKVLDPNPDGDGGRPVAPHAVGDSGGSVTASIRERKQEKLSVRALAGGRRRQGGRPWAFSPKFLKSPVFVRT